MRRSVVVIGNFDGVHTGHQAVLHTALRRCASLARARGSDIDLPLVVVTFWPHPLSVIRPDASPMMLQSLPDRIDMLKHHGAHEVRVVQFTRDVAHWTPAEFVERVLTPLDPMLVVIGTNFRFGHEASGDEATLRDLGRDRFDVHVLDLLAIGGQRTSSTLIRSLVADGRVEAAAEHLGHLFRVRGVVVVGDQRGRHLGFPTANLPVPTGMATPADGVYAGWLSRLDDPTRTPLPAAISVGTNPTFDGPERRVETYVLDRTDLELYGVEIAVEFVTRLRPQVRFDGIDPLIAQMTSDVARARQLLGAR